MNEKPVRDKSKQNKNKYQISNAVYNVNEVRQTQRKPIAE